MPAVFFLQISADTADGFDTFEGFVSGPVLPVLVHRAGHGMARRRGDCR